MLIAKRAYGLAAASAAMVCAIALPTSAPIAGDVIVVNVDASDIDLNVPQAAGLHMMSLTRIDAESVDHDAALASEITATGPAPVAATDLAELVEQVSDMNDVELTDDLRCLASAVYYEARGESIEGQLAVAQVILNRAASSRWPSGICKVVYQRGQFSYTFDGRPDFPATPNAHWKRAEAIAIIAAAGTWQDVTRQALFFHASYVSPGWRHKKEETRRIGRHVFYR